MRTSRHHERRPVSVREAILHELLTIERRIQKCSEAIAKAKTKDDRRKAERKYEIAKQERNWI